MNLRQSNLLYRVNIINIGDVIFQIILPSTDDTNLLFFAEFHYH